MKTVELSGFPSLHPLPLHSGKRVSRVETSFAIVYSTASPLGPLQNVSPLTEGANTRRNIKLLTSRVRRSCQLLVWLLLPRKTFAYVWHGAQK